jgi:hypothetical protein
MPARPILTKPRDQADSRTLKRQVRPVEKRFLLKVDGQIKTSFDAKEPAATAGAAIKKLFPVVVVAIVDTEEGTTEIIKA